MLQRLMEAANEELKRNDLFLEKCKVSIKH